MNTYEIEEMLREIATDPDYDPLERYSNLVLIGGMLDALMDDLIVEVLKNPGEGV